MKHGKIRIYSYTKWKKIFFFQQGEKIQFINNSHSFKRFGHFKDFDRIVISSSNFSYKKIKNDNDIGNGHIFLFIRHWKEKKNYA